MRNPGPPERLTVGRGPPYCDAHLFQRRIADRDARLGSNAAVFVLVCEISVERTAVDVQRESRRNVREIAAAVHVARRSEQRQITDAELHRA